MGMATRVAAAAGGHGEPLEIRQLDDYRWLVPRQGTMRVEGLLYADEVPIEDLRDDPAVRQVANVACLPGIVGRSLAMPDVHRGYGFAIGGVVSPGGLGRAEGVRHAGRPGADRGRRWRRWCTARGSAARSPG